MGMFGPKEGTYGLHSEKDKRWNVSWRGTGFVTTAEYGVKDKVEELKKKYGGPPEDLEYSFWKD